MLVLESKKVVGRIFEVLGPVVMPIYTIRFNKVEEITYTVGTQIYAVKGLDKFVETERIKKIKGSDASNMYDEEIKDEEREFSDDETEQDYKRDRKQGKKKESPGGAIPRQNDERYVFTLLIYQVANQAVLGMILVNLVLIMSRTSELKVRIQTERMITNRYVVLGLGCRLLRHLVVPRKNHANLITREMVMFPSNRILVRNPIVSLKPRLLHRLPKATIINPMENNSINPMKIKILYPTETNSIDNPIIRMETSINNKHIIISTNSINPSNKQCMPGIKCLSSNSNNNSIMLWRISSSRCNIR